MSTDSDTDGADAPPPFPTVSPGYFPVRPADPRRRRRRRMLVALLVSAVALAVPAAVVLYLAHDLNGNITRLDGMLPPEIGRPSHATGAAAEAVNVLVLGADGRFASSRAANATSDERGSSDTVMMLHIDADRRGASIISIPPDSWVDVPGHGKARIGMASFWGGPALAVSTIERLTGVRVDHVAIVGWDGYRAMIDALGGVDVIVPKTAADDDGEAPRTPGKHHLDGSDAVRYARERDDQPGGDLESVARKQAVLRALSDSATRAASSPTTVYQLLDGLTHHLIVDSSWRATEMAKLALSLRKVGASDVAYVTVPLAGTGTVAEQSVVFLDRGADRTLWAAIREDRMSGWTAPSGSDVPADVVR